jgi:hypothetical protein
MKIMTKEISGVTSALMDMRKPMKSKNDTVFKYREDGTVYFDEMGEDDERLARVLSTCKGGSGHDSFLKDIIVHCDFTASHDFILQLYRYHFRDTASSESKMHGITKGSIGDSCNSNVSGITIDLVDSLIALFNNFEHKVTTAEYKMVLDALEVPFTDSKKDLFEVIIHNTPLGYELTFGEVTNYLQLKSMYKQRKSHKMSGWSKVFKEWVETLPYNWLIIGSDKCLEKE